ncbi:MAG: magnesium and cobalt transporter, partial [Psychromonas sp.]|uniref:transporter associated domain-containing protein n=1 Tax=Psychromonas sp. TaxID=1884585 RepID=UPI0039E5F4CA
DDEEEDDIRQIGKRTYVVNAMTSIDKFNTFFSTSFNIEGQDTVAGFIIHELGHLPRRGESITIDEHQFKVTISDNRRLIQLQVLTPKELSNIE